MQRALCPLRLVPGSSQMLFFLLFPCSNTQMDSTVLWVSVIFINFLRLSIYVYFEGALRLCVPCLGSFDSHTVQFVSARQTWAVMDSSLCAGRFDFPSWRSFMEATVGSPRFWRGVGHLRICRDSWLELTRTWRWVVILRLSFPQAVMTSRWLNPRVS